LAQVSSQLELAEKKQKSIKLACRVFVFALPHSHRECTCADVFESVCIPVISKLTTEDTEKKTTATYPVNPEN